MENERVYTRMSGQAVKGLQRIVRDRKIYVRESASERGGYTVITKGKTAKEKRYEKLSA